MTTETDVPTAPLDSLVAGVLLFQFIEVGLGDYGAVELDDDMRAVDGHFLPVPFSNRLEKAALGSFQLIDGSVVLCVLELGIFRVAVIQDLQLHACR